MPKYFLLTLLMLSLSTSSFAHEAGLQAQKLTLDGGMFYFIWIGAQHMLTDYGHQCFLLGAAFFLRSFPSIIKFVTAFTIGNMLVLLAPFTGISANVHLIDAFIALTVIYVGVENLNGFPRLFAVKAPNLTYMVFLFGLVHGFGFATQLQTLMLADDPELVSKILLVNLGVALGQIVALCVMVLVINEWRKTHVWESFLRASNLLLITLGFFLFLFQSYSLLYEQEPLGELDHSPESGWHSHGNEQPHKHN